MGSGSSVEVKNNDDFSCSICFNAFDDNFFVPKALDCGHTFCLMCLKKLLVPSKVICPNCQRLFIKKSCNEYLTIYALINSSEKITSDLPVTKILESFEKKIKRKKDTVLKQTEELEKEIKAKNTYLQYLDNNLLKLETIKNQTQTDLDIDEVRKTISDIEKDNNEKFANSQAAIGKIRTSQLDLKDFAYPNHYLREIMRIVKRGTHIYTILDIGIKMKHGDICVEDGHILFHCASNEWEETENNSTAISIKDVRACSPFVARHPDCFLKIRTDYQDVDITVLIQMKDSPVTSQFLNLCTGEKGPCYKGTPCFNEDGSLISMNVLKVKKNYISNDKAEKGELQVVRGDWNKSFTEAGELIVLGNIDGSFEIVKALQNQYYISVIGQVVSPLHLDELLPSKYGEFARIIDSGISFPL